MRIKKLSFGLQLGDDVVVVDWFMILICDVGDSGDDFDAHANSNINEKDG